MARVAEGMNRRVWVCSALAVLALAAPMGCSRTSEPAPTDDGSGASTAGTATSHESRTLGYSLRLPPGWTVLSEAYLDWEMGVPPHRGSPPFDSFIGSDVSDPWLLVGSMAVPPRTGLDGWIDQLRETETITYPDLCEPPALQGGTTLGGEPARLVGLACPRDFPQAVGIQVLALHRGAGYYLLCYSEEVYEGRLDELRRDCEDWVAGFRYLE